MVDIATPSSDSYHRMHKLRRIILLTFCVIMITLIGVLYSAAQPKSWYRNLTDQHLTLEVPPNIVRVGMPTDFPDVGVYTGSRADGIWIIHLPDSKLVALHAFCTHDGCSTSWLRTDNQFKCSCCGSEFKMDGTNSQGPAIQPLERYKIYLHRQSVMVNCSETLQHLLGESKLTKASISMDNK